MGVNSYLSLIIAALICCVSLSFCDNGRDGQGTLIFAHIVSRIFFKKKLLFAILNEFFSLYRFLDMEIGLQLKHIQMIRGKTVLIGQKDLDS